MAESWIASGALACTLPTSTHYLHALHELVVHLYAVLRRRTLSESVRQRVSGADITSKTVMRLRLYIYLSIYTWPSTSLNHSIPILKWSKCFCIGNTYMYSYEFLTPVVSRRRTKFWCRIDVRRRATTTNSQFVVA